MEPTGRSQGIVSSIFRILGLLLVAWYFVACLQTHDFSSFVDNIDLIIHEAGHFVFIFFGDLMHFVGGSLLQVLMPLIFLGYFALRREFYSMAFMMIWTGYNIVMVSWYMDDALAMNLPLLGGDSSIHDWNHIFSVTHLLPYTHQIAHAFLGLGWLVTIAGIVLGIWFSLAPQWREELLSRVHLSASGKSL